MTPTVSPPRPPEAVPEAPALPPAPRRAPPRHRPALSGRTMAALFAVAVLVAFALIAVLRMTRVDPPVAPGPPPTTAYAPQLRTGTLEDQRRLVAEAASMHFVQVWLRPGSEQERAAALAPLMVEGSAQRPAADADLPAGELVGPPMVIKVDPQGALWLGRLSTGATVEIRGIFAPTGQFLVSDVQG